MMEHIRQFDWCTSGGERYFVEESDIDNCATEKIIRNKFYDPLISSDSENEGPNHINWDQMFKTKDMAEQSNRVYVPGLRPVPPFPKLSALKGHQHMQCLKVLCDANPHVLEAEFIRRPTKIDHRVFEEVKEIYAKEQKEFAEWAKSLWASSHCIRALRPKPPVESVYEAEFKLRANRMQAFPKAYEMAAQIPLETMGADCEMVHVQDLISVNVTELPEIRLPDLTAKKFNIIRPCTVPEPCVKHQCQFILPNETSVSTLPLPEIHRELAQYALECGASVIASESALKCLVEIDRHWALPLSVCDVINSEGEKCNVVVLGSEFSISKEAAPFRTYRAFRHLLEHALIPSSERMKVLDRGKSKLKSKTSSTLLDTTSVDNTTNDVDSDDDEGNLFIDTECDTQANTTELEDEAHERTENDEQENNGEMENGTEEQIEKNIQCNEEAANEISEGIANGLGIYSCTCKDSIFERPPPRSFKKWQVRDKKSGEKYHIIVHCSHKARSNSEEIVIEPIPEYQIDLGASLQSQHKINSIALSLLLRRNASLMNVRVEGSCGDVISVERPQPQQHGDVTARAGNTAHAALAQLQHLLPARYLLTHQPSHGSNALLYAPRALGGGQKLLLQFDTNTLDVDDATTVKTPPTLTPVLLPWHKHRKILPCAFSPYADHVAKEPKRAVTKQKAPPQAIKLDAAQRASGTARKWPKRKQKKKKNNNN